jgi:two-component system chemotaxis response regulator CheB
MTLERERTEIRIRLTNDPPVHSCRPAVDPLFLSVADVYGPGALGVILTGMGHDGYKGCERIRDSGGAVLVQDEASSVVWGMPGIVARAGIADKVVPLTEMAGEIARRASTGSRRKAPVESPR